MRLAVCELSCALDAIPCAQYFTGGGLPTISAIFLKFHSTFGDRAIAALAPAPMLAPALALAFAPTVALAAGLALAPEQP